MTVEDSPESKIAFCAQRAGIGADLIEMQRLVRSLHELEEAGRRVRSGLHRNDELAIAFQPPVEERR